MQALAQAALFPVRVQVRPSLGHGQHPTHGQVQILLDASLRRSPSSWPARGLEPPKKGLGAPVAGCGLMGPHYLHSHLRPQSATVASGLDLENWQEFSSGAQGFQTDGNCTQQWLSVCFRNWMWFICLLILAAGLSLQWLLLLWAQALGARAQCLLGSGAQASVVAVHGLSCSAAWDPSGPGMELVSLHQHSDSLPPSHQGSCTGCALKICRSH